MAARGDGSGRGLGSSVVAFAVIGVLVWTSAPWAQQHGAQDTDRAAILKALAVSAAAGGHSLVHDEKDGTVRFDQKRFTCLAAAFGRVRSWESPVPLMVLSPVEPPPTDLEGRIEGCEGTPLPTSLVVIVGETPLRVERLDFPCTSCPEPGQEEDQGIYLYGCQTLRGASLLAKENGPISLRTIIEDLYGDRGRTGTLTNSYWFLLSELPLWVETGYEYIHTIGGNCCAWDEQTDENAWEELEPWGLRCLFEKRTPIRTVETAWEVLSGVSWRRTRYIAYPSSVARDFPRVPVPIARRPWSPAWLEKTNLPPEPLAEGAWYCGTSRVPWAGHGELRVGVESTDATLPVPRVHLALLSRGGKIAPEIVVKMNRVQTRPPHDDEEDQPPRSQDAPVRSEVVPPPPGVKASWELVPRDAPVELMKAETLAATDRDLFLVLHWMVLGAIRYDDLVILSGNEAGTITVAKNELLATNLLGACNGGAEYSTSTNRAFTLVGHDDQGILLEETRYAQVVFSQSYGAVHRPPWPWDYKGPQTLESTRLLTRIGRDGRWVPVKGLPPLNNLRKGPKGDEILLAYPSKEPLFTAEWVPASLSRR